MANHVQVTGIHHIAMDVKDIDASIRFYSEVLGFEPVMAWGEGAKRACMLHAGNGSHIELFQGQPAEARPEGHWKHLAFTCADTRSAIERVRAAGFKITLDPKDVTIPSQPPCPVRIGFFLGPDGETIEFFEAR
jgi:glyoxylase I family protein